MCMGIIKGLYQFEQESQNDFVDWAVDMPAEYATSVLEEWKAGGQKKEDLLEVEQFIKKSLMVANGFGNAVQGTSLSKVQEDTR